MRKVSPCRGCDRRLIGCHGLCPDYKEWKKDLEQRKAAARDETPSLSREMQKYVWRKILRR